MDKGSMALIKRTISSDWIKMMAEHGVSSTEQWRSGHWTVIFGSTLCFCKVQFKLEASSSLHLSYIETTLSPDTSVSVCLSGSAAWCKGVVWHGRKGQRDKARQCHWWNPVWKPEASQMAHHKFLEFIVVRKKELNCQVEQERQHSYSYSYKTNLSLHH